MPPYLKFWGIDAPVFTRTADSGSLYLPDWYAPLLAKAQTFCHQPQALLTLEGQAGSGKSTLLRELSRALPVDSHEILLLTLVRDETEPGWLAPALCRFLGGKGPDRPGESLEVAAAGLEDLIREKRRLVVMIDAAQRLRTPEAFGEVSALLDLQAHAGEVLAFVLAGLDGFVAVAAGRPELVPRLGMHIQMPPFKRDETEAYIRRRCSVAGLDSPFDAEAVNMIHIATRGVPAAINTIAECALVEAWGRESKLIGGDLARVAVTMMREGQSGAESRQAASSIATARRDEVPAPPVQKAPISLTDLTSGVPERAAARKPEPTERQKATPSAGESRRESDEAATGRPKAKPPTIKMRSLFKPDEDGGS